MLTTLIIGCSLNFGVSGKKYDGDVHQGTIPTQDQIDLKEKYSETEYAIIEHVIQAAYENETLLTVNGKSYSDILEEGIQLRDQIVTTSKSQAEQARIIESALMKRRTDNYQDVFSTTRFERDLNRYFTDYQTTMTTCTKSDTLESIFEPTCLTPFLEIQQILSPDYQRHHEVLIDEIIEQISAMNQLESELESLSTKRQRIYRDCTGDTTTDEYEAEVTDSLHSVTGRIFDCINTTRIGSMEVSSYCLDMRQDNSKSRLDKIAREERQYTESFRSTLLQRNDSCREIRDCFTYIKDVDQLGDFDIVGLFSAVTDSRLQTCSATFNNLERTILDLH